MIKFTCDRCGDESTFTDYEDGYRLKIRLKPLFASDDTECDYSGEWNRQLCYACRSEVADGIDKLLKPFSRPKHTSFASAAVDANMPAPELNRKMADIKYIMDADESSNCF